MDTPIEIENTVFNEKKNILTLFALNLTDAGDSTLHQLLVTLPPNLELISYHIHHYEESYQEGYPT